MKKLKSILIAVFMLSATALNAIQPGLYVVATDFAKADARRASTTLPSNTSIQAYIFFTAQIQVLLTQTSWTATS